MALTHSVVGVTWRRLHGAAHAFVDEIPCCPKGKVVGDWKLCTDLPKHNVCMLCEAWAIKQMREDGTHVILVEP